MHVQPNTFTCTNAHTHTYTQIHIHTYKNIPPPLLYLGVQVTDNNIDSKIQRWLTGFILMVLLPEVIITGTIILVHIFIVNIYF